MPRAKKTSDTSIRVLETLKILCQEKASIQDIIHHFEKIYPDNKAYTNEVILKYINTLKVSGLRFKKEKGKYILLNSPLQFDFSEQDLKTISLIEKAAKFFPEKAVQEGIHGFLQDLEKRFSDNSKIVAHNLKKPSLVNLDLNYEKYSEQIKKYEKYCNERQRLKITYKQNNKKETSIMAEPNEIKYIGNNIYLSVYNPFSAQIQDINFNSILKTEQLPLKSNPVNMVSSVIFELKGRLAKAYRMHESEKLLQIKDDENIVILNQKEDRTLLLKRLIRYGENCEVISPKNLREEMQQMITNTLANYY